MSKKLEYTILFLFSLFLLGLFVWQMQNRDVGLEDLNPKLDNTPIVDIEEAPVVDLSCEVDSDCEIDETIIHCPAEVRCEDKQCVTYCIYDEIDQKEMFTVSECLDDVSPLEVRSNEYSLNWNDDDELIIKFNIVLSCSIDNLSAYYELSKENHLSLYYEYVLPEETEACLCVRELTYKIPNLNRKLDYNIIINKIEK